MSQKIKLLRNLKVNKRTKIQTTIIAPAALCGCEVWFSALREEYILRILRKGVKENI
jgi:hypothetical protein